MQHSDTALTGWIIDLVRLELDVPSRFVVQVGSAIWKRGYDLAFRAPDPTLPETLNSRSTSLIDGVDLRGQYINVKLNLEHGLELARNKGMAESTSSAASIAVEHTSMTPAYPLNISTLRGSLLGDVIVRAKGAVGGEVSPRYFLDDRSWHAGVIGDRHQRWIHLKPDHAVGRAFAQAVFARRDITARAALQDAIRLFPEEEVRAFGESEKFPDAVSACHSGVRTTL